MQLRISCFLRSRVGFRWSECRNSSLCGPLRSGRGGIGRAFSVVFARTTARSASNRSGGGGKARFHFGDRRPGRSGDRNASALTEARAHANTAACRRRLPRRPHPANAWPPRAPWRWSLRPCCSAPCCLTGPRAAAERRRRSGLPRMVGRVPGVSAPRRGTRLFPARHRLRARPASLPAPPRRVIRRSPVLRFAPSPNGRLHLGHAFSALLNDRIAKEFGGVCRLRIEDIDPVRSKPDFTDAILTDLAWLGLTYPEPIRHQSRHLDEYAAARDRLAQAGLAYPCFCSRGEIRASVAASGGDRPRSRRLAALSGYLPPPRSEGGRGAAQGGRAPHMAPGHGPRPRRGELRGAIRLHDLRRCGRTMGPLRSGGLGRRRDRPPGRADELSSLRRVRRCGGGHHPRRPRRGPRSPRRGSTSCSSAFSACRPRATTTTG